MLRERMSGDLLGMGWIVVEILNSSLPDKRRSKAVLIWFTYSGTLWSPL